MSRNIVIGIAALLSVHSGSVVMAEGLTSVDSSVVPNFDVEDAAAPAASNEMIRLNLYMLNETESSDALPSKSSLQVGDRAVICLTSEESRYAKVWDIQTGSNNQVKRRELLPNRLTEGRSGVTDDNRALALQAGETLCFGQASDPYRFRIQHDEVGEHHLWIQHADRVEELYAGSDFPVFQMADDMTAFEYRVTK